MTECQLRAYLATALTNLSVEERAEVFRVPILSIAFAANLGLISTNPKIIPTHQTPVSQYSMS